jgi:hypothetical protein
MNNIEKINLIIEQYKDQEIKYFTDFYEQIQYLDINDAIKLYEVVPPDIPKPEFIHRILNYHGDRKITFDNYILFQVGNMNGISLVLVHKDINLKNRSPYDIFIMKILPKGMKLYINTNCYELKQEVWVDIDQKDFDINGKHYQLGEYSCFQNMIRESGIYKILLCNLSQFYLTEAFLEELFIEIDKNNFIDCLAMKYYPHEKRIDRINLYISTLLRNNTHLFDQLIAIIKNLITKYTQQGLKFHENHFILPYEFDKQRIIANTYIADSFYKSLLFFILFYMKKDLKFCKDFFYYHDIYDYSEVDKLKEYIINIKNVEFEEFVFDILRRFNVKNQEDYLLTYSKLFEF